LASPFRYLDSSPAGIRLAGMMDVRDPLSLRNVENLLAERGVDMRPERSFAHVRKEDIARPVFAASFASRRPLAFFRFRRGAGEVLFQSRVALALVSGH
jgi:hypothetical protein